MKYLIGIDGGGSKTDFCLADEQGNRKACKSYGSASYKQIGVDGVLALLAQGIEALLHEAGLKPDDATELYTVFGMPNYGESIQNDGIIVEIIQERFAQYHVTVVNDCEVGWAGSLLLNPGINIVAGTGSIAYGKNGAGEAGRTGGWNDCFSDEGSGKWMGVKAMETFFKQVDGRLPKGPLYRIVRAHFQVDDDVAIVDAFEEQYQPYRDKVASLQRLLCKAAEEGDSTALQLYDLAGAELASMIRALYLRLHIEGVCTVSYSGGLFRAGTYLLDAIKDHLQDIPLDFQKPKSTPVMGAVLLAGYYNGINIPTEYFA